MQTATLGRTGVELTRLGLGCAPIGDLLGSVSDATARDVMQSAWDAGVRYFDTSPFYGHGKSEHRLGEFLRGRPREQFKVSTKVGRVLRPTTRPDLLDQEYWRDPLPFTLHFDYSYDGIMRSYEDSLQRLGLGSVDLLVIHDLDQMFHHSEQRIAALMQEVATSGWRALDQLRSSGAVSGVGAGINFVGLIPRFLDLMELDFFLVAQDYNLLDHDVLDHDFPRCAAAGVRIIVGALFASGILATGGRGNATYRYAAPPPEVVQRVQAMAAVCHRHGVDLATAALQFPLAHPLVTAVIPGAARPEYVTGNVQRLQTPVPADLWTDLKSEALLRPDAPVPCG
ncbi:MAG: aldo/keto reductase [Spirochaetaceae bacterium]|nr:aldo/keto reductase [Spirochaetaceae bacterium]